MKKSLLFLFSVLMIITSCSKDNETINDFNSKELLESNTLMKENNNVFNDIRSNIFENLSNSRTVIDNYNYGLPFDYNYVKNEIETNFRNNLKSIDDPNKVIDDFFSSGVSQNYTKNDIQNLTSISQIEKDLLIEAIDYYENDDIVGFADFIKRDTNYYLNHVSLNSNKDAKDRMIATLASFNGIVDFYDNSASFMNRGENCGQAAVEGAAWGAVFGAVKGLVRGCTTGFFLGFNPGSVAAGCMGGMIVGMVQGAVVGAVEEGVRCELGG